MSRPARTSAVPAAIATVVLLAGLLLWALFRVVSGTEHHAYSASGVAPASFHVTAGKVYQLSVAGGVATLKDRGTQVSESRCEWSAAGSVQQLLQITADAAGTKAINVVAGFTAPVTGRVAIDCAGWGAVYVDDADGAPGDPSGYFLVLAVVALTVGVGLGLSALRTAGRRAAATRAAGEPDELRVGVQLGDGGGDSPTQR